MNPKKIINYFLKYKQATMLLFSLLVALLCFTVFLVKARKYPAVETPGPREQVVIDFNVLNKTEFQELEIFEGSGLPDQKGRPNPFIMYREEALRPEPSPAELIEGEEAEEG